MNANSDWLCPLCRDICNCSFHRSKRGWAPTGTLYRHAIAEGAPWLRKMPRSPAFPAVNMAVWHGLCPANRAGLRRARCALCSLHVRRGVCSRAQGGTFPLYPPVHPAGYKSVAHYLVLNNLSDEAKPVALERGLCPPELAGGQASCMLVGVWRSLERQLV